MGQLVVQVGVRGNSRSLEPFAVTISGVLTKSLRAVTKRGRGAARLKVASV